MTQWTDRIAIDIGGTSADLVTVDGDILKLEEASATPANFANGVLTAVEKGALDPASLGQFAHGTTVVISAITKRAGQETALLATTDFRDVLDIMRTSHPDTFNYQYEEPESFVLRRHRWEVDGRVDQVGSILTPFNEDGIRGATREMWAEGLDTIAVCYVHGYEDPEHEQCTRELIEEEYPEAYVTLFHELMREYREYEWTNTTVLNSYVRPIADTCLDNLETQLGDRDLTGGKYAMKSDASTASFARARRMPAKMVESGPVGGVYGAVYVGEQIDTPDVISFDIGDTTAEALLVQDGGVTIDTDYWLESSPRNEGYPLKAPVVDIVEIGTNGGSTTWTDPGGLINVDPKSSGADLGPACYGRSDTRPTVTDANLLTGRLNPDYFLGGKMDLNVDTTRDAVEPLADKFGTIVGETTRGVLRVVDSSTSNALKQVSTRRGYDLHDSVMVASGGAGSLHVATLGREFGVGETIIPRVPGRFSTWDMLMTDVRKDFTRTHVTSFEVSATEEITAASVGLEEDAYAAYEPEAGVDRGDVELEQTVDLRYAGQEHTVNVPLIGDAVTPNTVCGTIKRFHKRHDQTYDLQLDNDAEVVNSRLIANVPMPKPEVTTVERNGCPGDVIKETRTVDFGTEGVHNAHVYERDAIPATTSVTGPAVIEEPACTTLVHLDRTFDVDELGNIHIQQ